MSSKKLSQLWKVAVSLGHLLLLRKFSSSTFSIGTLEKSLQQLFLLYCELSVILKINNQPNKKNICKHCFWYLDNQIQLLDCLKKLQVKNLWYLAYRPIFPVRDNTSCTWFLSNICWRCLDNDVKFHDLNLFPLRLPSPEQIVKPLLPWCLILFQIASGRTVIVTTWTMAFSIRANTICSFF